MLNRITLIIIAFILCGAVCSAQNNNNFIKIEINKNTRIKLKVDSVYSLDFNTKPENYKINKIEWKSDNDSIIQITDANQNPCKIKFLKEGKAKITVIVDGKSSNSKTFKVGGGFSFGDFLFVLSVVGIVACAIVRWKFWNKIKKSEKKEKIFYGIVVFFVLILLIILFKIVRIIIIATAIVLILGIIIFYYIQKQKNNHNQTEKPERKKEKTDYAQEYEKLKEEFHALNMDYKRLQGFNKELLAEKNDWERRFKELERQTAIKHENIDSRVQITDYQNEPKSFVATALYADAIIDGFFNRVRDLPNEDTIFELCLHNVQAANFTIYMPAYKRIISNPSFLEGCDKQVLNNAQNVKIENEGTAQQQADGKWRIIKKLNVVIN